ARRTGLAGGVGPGLPARGHGPQPRPWQADGRPDRRRRQFFIGDPLPALRRHRPGTEHTAGGGIMSRVITYTLTLEEPCLLAAPGGDPNTEQSLPYIPGGAVRGALAAAF